MTMGVTTALHEAAALDNPTMLKLLLDHDESAAVNELDAFGWTPLMRALECGSRNVLEVLTDADADWSLESCEGTPADIARQNNCGDLVQSMSLKRECAITLLGELQ